MQTLEAYDWPGNVRELENVLQRAIILSPGTTLALGDAWMPSPQPTAVATEVTLVEIEKRHIRTVLDTTRWRIEGGGGAAQLLGSEAEHAPQPDAQAGDRQAALSRLQHSAFPRSEQRFRARISRVTRARTSSRTMNGSSRIRMRTPLKIWNSRDSKKASAASASCHSEATTKRF